MNYKATENYFDIDGNLIENLCGFGNCKNLDEAQKQYKPTVKITEITESELAELKAKRDF